MPNVIIAALVYFATVFSAAFAIGVLRTLVIAPAIGEMAAVLIEVPIVLALSWWVCAWVLRRIPVPTGLGRIGMGVVAFALLMVAELLLSILIGHRTVAEHLALFYAAPMIVGLSGQIGFAVVPWLQHR
ncbi:MAG: hypothetical protein WCC57_01785 [Paracoccaceae bacterium]